MDNRIAFVKTGWSDEYSGGPVVGRHTHISEYEEAHEKYNFLKAPNKRYYAYIPPIGSKYRPPQPKNNKNWLIVFVSARDGNGPLTVVGWYENATFEREYQSRPEYKSGIDFETDVDGNYYSYCISTNSANLIPNNKRDIVIPGNHFKRTPIVYAKGHGKKDEWRDEFTKIAEDIVKNGVRQSSFPEKELRQAVEEASIKEAFEYLKKKNYKVTDRQKDNCGYDLLAKREKSPQELHVEVKGTSLETKRFFMSRNERQYMPNPKWRLLIVTNALVYPEVTLLTEKQVETMFKFNVMSWEAVLKR
ncbi:MAG: DUF3883 domain-containing protein [Proteobacteria bacterium]|nr:DUF3883 domain-containing protein [Desulfobacula sp.]MBU3952073.1 DUF3883 domain-containing protein [Pseudomonadota bacterium]